MDDGAIESHPGLTVTATATWATPTDDEMAAIIAAVDAVWPKPQPTTVPDRVRSQWRFSGRWWSKPVPLRRDRP